MEDFEKTKAYFWFERFKKYLEVYKGNYVCSWWMRLEYENDEKPASTAMINYYLDKCVAKGLLTKESNPSHTKYFLK